MSDLRDLLWRRRRERGALDLDIPRLHLRVNETGEVVEVERDERDPSRHLIEEFMVAANEAVARTFAEKGLPIVSRVHPPPDEDGLEDFFFFLECSGLKVLGRGARSRDLQRIVEATAREPLAPLIHLALLRSLAHAEYSPSPGLHFALAASSYCHFTSPIRRYPDLLVHQILDGHLDGNDGNARRRIRWEELLPRLAASSSCAERRAEEAEREMTKLRYIRHLEPRLGEEMEGMVISVHPFGFFVRVEEGSIEGLVHVAALTDDFYDYDGDALCLRGRRRRRTFRLGDGVKVILSELDPDLREIGFRFVAKMDSPRRHGEDGRTE